MQTGIADIKTYRHLASVRLESGFSLELPYSCIADGQTYFADRLEPDGMSVKAVIGESSVTDTFETEGPLLCVTRRWNLAGAFDACLPFTVIADIEVERLMIPGAVYASGDAAREESRRAGHVSECRCSIPCCAALAGAGSGIAVFTEPARSAEDLGAAAALIDDGTAGVTITTPGAGGPMGGGPGAWPVDGRVAYERKFYIFTAECGNAGDFMDSAVNEAWRILAFPPEITRDWTGAVEAKTLHLAEDFFIERGDAVGFVAGIGPMGYPRDVMLESAGPGGNIEAARALYRVGRAVGSKSLRRIALDTADFFLSAQNELQEMKFDYHPATRRWQQCDDDRLGVRRAGEILLSTMRLHRSAADGDRNPRWLHTSKKIAGRLFDRWRIRDPGQEETERSKNVKGKKPGVDIMREEAWPAAAFVELHRATGDADYLEAAEWLGGRLASALRPAVAPDSPRDEPLASDAAHAQLRAFLMLHGETGRAEYLDAALKAAAYLRSLCFVHGGRTPPGSRLDKAGFSATGAIPDTPGADFLSPSAIAFAPDLLELWDRTGDALWRDMAVMALEFSGQLIHPPEDTGGSPPARGRQPARFFHCPLSSSSRSWGTASGIYSSTAVITLAALLDIHEAFPETLGLKLESISDFPPAQGDIIPRVLRYAGSFLNFFS